VEDSSWEPDGVTHHVRFCEGPGVTVGWLRSCGTAGKPGGNRENKYQPVPLGEPGLLTNLHFRNKKKNGNSLTSGSTGSPINPAPGEPWRYL